MGEGDSLYNMLSMQNLGSTVGIQADGGAV